MAWTVVVIEPARAWLRELRSKDRATARQIGSAIDVLVREGPALGRPLADTVTGSSIANLKELRPASVGATEVRLLFVFDPQRRAVFLVAGDKSGRWSSWYSKAIKQAEEAYGAYLEATEGQSATGQVEGQEGGCRT
ncbi:type II toxin-antitoxin system RelE/ParE family toxin [Streptomyces beijiangensis]|uniref:Type II toxin-antitoxin system RelE/ParE family toxin n=1 Tax=Streptomyces beijiangensis TaxID=163361 RepID=A0A939FBU0_9ACTN|nr:type II toxin-antitoxin system RelE/ParE family toxin [Streptomyces beijiangensis]MBO0514572.1 type II toxin-antitoxin system RelE/ParE family toxin [Streptomyces beijiangensis]